MTGSDVRRIRESLGLTQAKFAEMLGYGAQSRVSELESLEGKTINKRAEWRITVQHLEDELKP